MAEIVYFPVMEHFNTIQGEGFHTGRAAFFIRLAGCDVGCVWCDVKESWHTEGYPTYTAKQLAEMASEHPSDIVVLTGGEPAMYDLTDLCKALHEAGKLVHIETSGAYALEGKFDWVCFSPKKFKNPLIDVGFQADELKVVIYNKFDFEWAESFENEVREGCRLYLQPEWEKRVEVQTLIIDYIFQHPNWCISQQTHKYLGVD